MSIKVNLHGHLKEKVSEDIYLNASNIVDVLRQITVKYPELKAPVHIGRWPIKIKDYETKESFYLPLYTKEIDIYPLFEASKSEWVSIGIGVALVVAGGFVAAAYASAYASAAAMAAEATAAGAEGITAASFLTTGAQLANLGAQLAIGIGTSMIISGVMQALSPSPKVTANTSDPEASKYLGAPGNTTSLGTYIPIGYGKYKVSGHYISYNISTKEFAYKGVEETK